jgi:hypothetical protein
VYTLAECSYYLPKITFSTQWGYKFSKSYRICPKKMYILNPTDSMIEPRLRGNNHNIICCKKNIIDVIKNITDHNNNLHPILSTQNITDHNNLRSILSTQHASSF